jgi:hypothetical protein
MCVSWCSVPNFESCLGEAGWRTSMERAVAGTGGDCDRSRSLTGAGGPERQIEIRRSSRWAALFEMRLHERRAGSRYNQWPRSSRRGHNRGAAYRKVRRSGEGEHGHESDHSGKCPDVTGPRTHIPRLTENPAITIGTAPSASYRTRRAGCAVPTPAAGTRSSP